MRNVLRPSKGSSGSMGSKGTGLLVAESCWWGSMAAVGSTGGVGAHSSSSSS